MNNSCTHFKKCSGCVYSTLEKAPKIFEEAAFYFKKLGFSLFLTQKSMSGWRLRAKLAVRKGAIGLFKEGTHEVIDIPKCIVHHPRINEAVERFRRLFLESGLSSYDEKTGLGDLRYIQLVVERSSLEVQLTLVINQDEKNSENARKLCALIWEENDAKKPFWHSLWLNFNTKKSNTIFGEKWIHLFGKECIWEEILGVSIPYGPSHFGQANLDLFEELLLDLRKAIVQGAKVIEFYGGSGAIGLSIGDKCAHVTISEREKSAEKYFEMAKERLPIEVQKKVFFVSGKATDLVSQIGSADTCIVDPPRKGLEKAFIQAISSEKEVKHLAYVSCNFESLKRDCEELLNLGWAITYVKSYLFFPGTNHIELLAIFTKKSG